MAMHVHIYILRLSNICNYLIPYRTSREILDFVEIIDQAMGKANKINYKRHIIWSTVKAPVTDSQGLKYSNCYIHVEFTKK